MLIVSIILFILLFFPIKVSTWAVLITTDRKLYFRIELFRLIKIVGGYATLEKDGIAVHINENKAIIIPYKNVFNKKIRLKPINGLNVVRLNSVTNLYLSNQLGCSLISAGYNCFYSALSSIMHVKKPFLNLNNDLNVYYTNDNSFNLNSYFLLDSYFNIFVIFEFFMKKFLEKIIYVLKKRK